jgi:hypothetical protein
VGAALLTLSPLAEVVSLWATTKFISTLRVVLADRAGLGQAMVVIVSDNSILNKWYLTGKQLTCNVLGIMQNGTA